MKYNYHTHTVRCHHAEGRDEDYVLKAIEAEYEEIGFSDHCAWPFENFTSPIRMRADEIEEYTESVKALREKLFACDAVLTMEQGNTIGIND